MSRWEEESRALGLLKVSLMRLDDASTVNSSGRYAVILTSGDGLSGVFWKRGVL